jgi:hypothetical protein
MERMNIFLHNCRFASICLHDSANGEDQLHQYKVTTVLTHSEIQKLTFQILFQLTQHQNQYTGCLKETSLLYALNCGDAAIAQT